MENFTNHFLAYSLDKNLDCNKICQDIQKLISNSPPPNDNKILKVYISRSSVGGDELILKLPGPT